MLSGIRIKPKQAAAGSSSAPPQPVQRESWMTDAGMVAVSSSFTRPPSIKKTSESVPAKPKPIDLAKGSFDLSRPSAKIGDGGASWRRRIERRQRELQETPPSDTAAVRNRPKSDHPLLSDRGDRPPPETIDDLNQLAAEAMKAKLMGDVARHDALQERVASARRNTARVVIVPDDGRPVRMASGGSDGVRYLAQQERLQARSQFQIESAMEIARNTRFSLSTDEQFDASHSDVFDRPAKKKPRPDEDKAQLISAHHRFQSQIDSCLFCMEGRRIQRHLVVSIGRFCYLSLPETPPLGLGHCYIVPSSHTSAVTAVDDDVYDEMQAVKRQLVRMFAARSQQVVFLETCPPGRPRHHAVIECVPMDEDMYVDAPIYFKKGLLEADEEWSSHKKIIEISRHRPIRSAIPGGFPYFCVEFGSDGSGYAHVIEDKRKFAERFGLQIICGLLQEHPEIVFRAKPESRDVQLERMKQFREMWDKFDCLAAAASTSE